MRGWRKGLALLVGTAVLCGASPAFASASTVYVAGTGAAAGSGTDSGNCQTETSPCATITYALAQAGSGGTVAIAGTVDEDNVTVSADATFEQDPLDAAAPATIMEHSGDLNSLFAVGGSADVTFSGLAFQDGSSSTNGGAISDTSTGTVTVSGDTFSFDAASGDGGAIYVNTATGELDVSNSVFWSNGNGEISGVPGNGGAIADEQAALLTIRGSTFSTNESGGDGGAIYIADAVSPGTQPVSIVGSTFAANTGGGSSVALSDNAAGNAIYAQSATLDTAGNLFDGTCEIGASDTQGEPVDKGYNVAVDDSCLGPSVASDVASPRAEDVYPLPSSGAALLSPTTMAVGSAGAAAGSIPASTSVTLDAWVGGSGATLALCPVTDAVGVASSGSCNAGAAQTIDPRPVVYVAGSDAPNYGTASDATSCGAYTAACKLLTDAVLASKVNYPPYSDPILDVDGTVAEDASSPAAIQLSADVQIQQDPRSGATPAVIQGDGSDALFDVAPDSGHVEIDGITLENADPAVDDYDTTAADTLTLTDDTFSTDGDPSANGGAVDMYSPGTLRITGSTFDGNTASQGGSLWVGQGGTAYVDGSSFSDDTADYGGGIAAGTGGDATLYVSGSSFDHETATTASGEGGAIQLGSGSQGIGHVSYSTFTNDSAAWGGAIAAGLYGSDGELTVTDSIFSADSAQNAGGAIAMGVYAGGADVAATAKITGSVFSGDSAGGNGGAIDSGDLAGSGVLTVSGSSFVGDYTTGSAALGGDSDGGAIDSGDPDGVAAEASSGTLTVTGSTFYGDYVGSASSSPTLAGPAINEGTTGTDSATVAGDIFDGVSAGDVPPSGTATPLCSGTFTDLGYNAGTDGSCYASAGTDLTASVALDAGIEFHTRSVSSVGAPAQALFAPASIPEVQPLFSSSLVGLIPDPTAVGGSHLCPVTADILGIAGPYGAAAGCAPGALQAYVPIAPDASAYPSAITADSSAAGAAGVSWTAPSLTAAGGEITGYTVTPHDLTTGADGSAVTTPGTSVAFTGLAGGDTYVFRVVTNNSAGSSEAGSSNQVQVRAAAGGGGAGGAGGGTGGGAGGGAGGGQTTSTPTPTPLPSTVEHRASLDNQKLTLITVRACVAPGKTAGVRLVSSAIAGSKKPKLRFVEAVLTLAGKQAHTERRPSSTVRFKLKAMKRGLYTVRAVVSYEMPLPHGHRRLVRKTITAELSVC